MKKILLLGGSAQQVTAIKTAKRLGYHTILCDYLPDNPGQYEADEFYQISTTDKEAVLKVAKEASIDGIVSYSSDPAAPTVAYVAERLSLPGIPYKTAEIFCNKNLFRQFLMNNGFNVPRSVEIANESDIETIGNHDLPIIIKPTDSSGSKGVTVVHDLKDLHQAIDYAMKFSRNKILIAEEFIERDHPYVIEAELFVSEGKVVVWGLIDTIRDPLTNPLLPASYCYPLSISPNRIRLVKNEIQKLISTANVRYGAFNMEMIITSDEKLYFLDVGPRNGGNELPEYIGMIMGEDLVEATVCTAMGDYDYLNSLSLDGHSNGYWGMMVLHVSDDGIFERVEYDAVAREYLLEDRLFKNTGDQVNRFRISSDALGLAIFRFPDLATRDAIMNDFRGEHIQIRMKGLGKDK